MEGKMRKERSFDKLIEDIENSDVMDEKTNKK